MPTVDTPAQDPATPTAQALPAKSATFTVYEAILERILNGELPRNTRLQERHLAEQLQTSRTPVREALRRLESERLVSRDDARQISVREVRIEEIIQILNVRTMLEGPAAELAARHIPRETVDTLRDAVESLLDSTAPQPDEHWHIDDRVHETIAEASENRVLVDYVRDLRRRTRMFDMRRVRARFEPGCAEHLAILDALAQRDGAAARDAMQLHIANAKEGIIHRLDTG